jgi:hypothetical protein
VSVAATRAISATSESQHAGRCGRRLFCDAILHSKRSVLPRQARDRHRKDENERHAGRHCSPRSSLQMMMVMVGVAPRLGQERRVSSRRAVLQRAMAACKSALRCRLLRLHLRYCRRRHRRRRPRSPGQARQRVFLSHSILKMIILPRQARDKHRESTQKVRSPGQPATSSG